MKNSDEQAPGAATEKRDPAHAKSGTSDLANAARTSAGKTVWMGTAVGIGSAAIVAALLYARKKK